VLDLKTGVEFEEEESILGRLVKELDCSCRDVADESSKTDCCLLHALECFGSGDGYGGFFDDLLVTTLDRTVSAEERHCIAILIC